MNHINPDRALELFHRRYPMMTVNLLTITDILPDSCRAYSDLKDCWFVLFSGNPLPMGLQSSRLVAISKSTGEIVFASVANDEE
jgi:hypothetical protein